MNLGVEDRRVQGEGDATRGALPRLRGRGEQG
jgi:hypothetical protein